MNTIPDQIAKKLKEAATTPVAGDDGMARRIAIDKAIAWCKNTFPNHFHGDDYAPPTAKRLALRRGASERKIDGSGD